MCIHMYVHICICTVYTFVHVYMHAYLHMHVYMYNYVHTYIQVIFHAYFIDFLTPVVYHSVHFDLQLAFPFLFFVVVVKFFLFLVMPSSPTRDRACTPCCGSRES